MELPLSPSQERMYFLQMADPESRAFNTVFTLSFSSEDGQALPLQPSLLTPALELVLQRNASLRVTFHQDGSDENHALMQRIHPVEDFEVCRINRASLAASERGLKDAIQEEIFKPFDLSSQAFRFVVFRPAPGEIKMCMVVHHLIMDGLSASFLSRDILKLVCGKQLPELAETPEDHLARVMHLSRANTNEDSGAKQRKLKTWTELLETAESCASLSVRADAPRLPSADYNECAHQYIRVPKKIMSAIKLLSKSKGVSMTAVLSTIFAACVYSYTGLSDIIIGVLSMSRTAETQSTVAYLANALPLRVDFTRRLPLSDLLRQVQKNWSLVREGGVDLQDLLPHVSCLRRSSGAGRSMTANANPLQVMLSYLNLCNFVPEKVLGVDGREFSSEYTELRSGHTHADLYLEVHPWRFRQSGGDFTFCWEYRKAVVMADEVCRLHDLFLRAVESFAAGASVEEALKLGGSRPSLRENSEKQMSLYVGSEEKEQTTSVPNRHLLYIPRFEEKASEIPTHTAFRYDGEEVSYAQTQQLMTQLAVLLYARGVRSGDHVAIYMHRTHWLYLAVLATLKCAAAYVPIALQNPPERVARILKLSEATLLVTEESLLRNLPPGCYDGATLCIDTQTIGETIANETAALLPVMPEFDYHPDHIFYIIFTSGTTGEPKGIAITHGNMRAFVNVFMSRITPEMTSVTLASSNISFDAHGIDFLGPLLNGACLVVVDSILNMRDGITFAFASPSAARLVEFPRDMRAVIVGGEVFTLACYKNLKHVPLVINGYGPTECTVYVSEKRVQSAQDIASIGRVHMGVTAMVLDESKHLVPIGSTGILHITGAQVSDIGYYKNPEKNEEAFLCNPYKPSETMYNTRDVVRMLPDGSLQFLGRSDDQVKLRGMRFQLLEVENTLTSHPKVSTASATVRNKGDSTAQLVAYLTPALDSPSLEAVLHHVRSHLPSYMVPSLVLSLEKMPLTKEGKVDRRALGQLPLGNALCMSSDQAGDPDSESSVTSAETSKTAAEIAAVFEKVLGLEKCSVSADFFASGGHSLLTFRLVQLLNKEFSCCLNIAHVLQHSTPSSLAKVIIANCRQSITVMKTDARSKPMESGNRSQAVCQTRETASTSESPNSSKSRAQAHTEYSPPKVSRSTSSEVVKEEKSETVCADSFLGSKESGGAPNRECAVPRVSKSEGRIAERSDEIWNFNYLSPVPCATLSAKLSASLELLFKSGSKNLRSTSLEEISAKLWEESGFQIPAAALLHYPSLEVLQTHLKLKTVLTYTSTAQSPTVVIHPPKSPSDIPVFFVHGGIIGWPFPYIRLAQSLERYSVAVQRTVAAPTSSFEDMAAYYTEAVRSMQPRGPYTLIGVCFGAQLLYEMCRQLGSVGERVKLAVMVNNSPAIEKLPSVFDDLGRPLPHTPPHPFHFLQSTLQLKLPESITENPKTVGSDYSEEAEVDALSATVLEEIPWLPFTATELKEAYLSFLKCLRCVWFQYRPRPTTGIESCILIRDGRNHPLFLSHGYGLLGLVPPGTLSVLVSPQPLGLLSDKATMEYIGSVLRLYLEAALPCTD